jgi:hypothetical protein
MSELWHSKTYIKTITFQDKQCHRSDIPEQTLPELWHSRTKYVKEVTFWNKLSQKLHFRTNFARVVTFQDKVCQRSDIPEQTMSELWNSRTNYVTEVTFHNKLRESCDIPELWRDMTFLNTILTCWRTAFINIPEWNPYMLMYCCY